LAKLTPLRELNAEEDYFRGFVEVCRHPWLRSATHLYSVRLDDHTAEALIACPYLTGLRVLQTHTEPLSPAVRRRFCRHFAAALVDGS
jgi:hypothetical protein